MSVTLYLHIGMNKTGSSAIQSYFSSNRDSLACNGLLYPRTGCAGNAHYHLSSMLDFLHAKPTPVDLQSRSIRELSNSLWNEVELYSPSEVLVSSEYFVLPRSVVVVGEFFAKYDVKIVIYLRRHDKWWPSAYNQAVRTVTNPPWDKTFKSYIDFFYNNRPDVGNYPLLLDRWAEVFGKENMIVRPYEERQNEPGLVVDFMKAIGRDDLAEEVIADTNRVNDSVDMTTLLLIDTFQRARISPDVRESLINHVLSNKKPSSIQAGMDPKLLLELAERHQDDYAYIAREYLGRADGRLFYDPLPDASMSWQESSISILEQVMESVAVVLGAATKEADSVLLECKALEN